MAQEVMSPTYRMLSPPNPLPGTLDIHQIQMLERLKQLRLWQQQQQEELLQQQQQELSVIKNEQNVIRARLGLKTEPPTTEYLNTGRERETKFLTPFQYMYHQQSHHTDQQSPITDHHSHHIDTTDHHSHHTDTTDQLSHYTDQQSHHPDQQSHCTNTNNGLASSPPDIVHITSTNRSSIRNSLQPEGHTISGSSLVSANSADSGMLSGQSSSTDVQSKRSPKSEEHVDECSSGFQTPESNGINESDDNNETDDIVLTEDQHFAQSVINKSVVPHDEIPIKPGIGPDSASTFEELLEKKLKLYEHSSSNLPPPRRLVKCPSEDSFLIRKEQREQEEEAELAEFELLEKAAQESSFSSQCSLVLRMLDKNEGHLSSSPKTQLSLLDRKKERRYDLEERRSLSLSPVETEFTTNIRPSTISQPTPQSFSLNPPSMPQALSSSLIPNPPSLNLTQFPLHRPLTVQTNSPLPSVQEDEEIEDLDSTLRPSHSQAVRFDDEEVWESFTNGTPKHSPYDTPDFTPRASPNISKESSPVLTFGENSIVTISKPKISGAVRKVRVLSSAPLSERSVEVDNLSEKDILVNPTTSSTTIHPSLPSPHHIPNLTSVSPEHQHQDSGSSRHGNVSYSSNLPPPSALVAKLFPSLRKDKDNQKLHFIETLKQKGVDSTKQPTIIQSSYSPVPLPPPSISQDVVSIDEMHLCSPPSHGIDKQVREKLSQLEREISRFKMENGILEKLRIEREEALLHFKQEVSEFQHQKEQEIERFEQYKQEELKKLKKERKVFDTYQRESHSVRDKKNKEEMIALKQELDEVKDELRQKESRWSTTLSRYRLRIESLESQNEELQNDLRMMEEQRLLWWQQQLETKTSPVSLRHQKSLSNSLSPLETSQLSDNEDDVIDYEINKKETVKISHVPSLKTQPRAIKTTKQRRKSDPPIRPPTSQSNFTGKGKENKIPKRVNSSSPASVGVSKQQSKNRFQSVSSIYKHNKKRSTVESVEPVKPVNRRSISKPVLTNKIVRNERVAPIISQGNRQEKLRQVQRSVSTLDEGKCQEDDEEDRDDTNVIKSGEEEEYEIIEVRAVDQRLDDTHLSDEADEIVAQVLDENEIEDPHSKNNKAMNKSTQSKNVRFNIIPLSSQVTPLDESWNELHVNKEDTNNVVVPSDNTEEQDIQEEYHEEDGSKVVLFPNGTRKVISSDNLTCTVYFFNGDIKRTQPDGSVVYYYSKCRTTHKTLNDGTEIVEFANGQSETHYPNGCKDIHFPDGTLRHMYPNGEEKVEFVDGVIQYMYTNGNKTIDFPDGQKETHTKQYKQREYPDGTIKTVYPDGRQETKYANGRLRIKDNEGKIIVDKMTSPKNTRTLI